MATLTLEEKVNQRMADSVMEVAKVVYKRSHGFTAKDKALQHAMDMEGLRELEFYEAKFQSYGGDIMDLPWNVT